MNTPLWDFVQGYCAADPMRLHMPGHKGAGPLGLEAGDLTEIPGADSLFEATGILAESEANASRLFGAHTFYSTEGSSLAIRAMVHLACLWARAQGRRPVLAAGRNAHKTFLSAAALLDLEPVWLEEAEGSLLSCSITVEMLNRTLEEHPEVTALYVTSPDYLGQRLDLKALAEVCHRHGILLLCDNAHGAYLKFLSPSLHPMDLGADLCCDSAHKTLPVLTGGAYLHLARHLPESLICQAKSALSLFASTSPSYLILQSLDQANAFCEEYLPRLLQEGTPIIDTLKHRLSEMGFTVVGDEPLKITLATKPYGYRGDAVADHLAKRGAVCEFSDPDFVVMMLSPKDAESVCTRIEALLRTLPKRTPLTDAPPPIPRRTQEISPRQAMLSPARALPLEQCVGRLLADPSVGCPPAVPILRCGQRITAADLPLFRYYGITALRVVECAE